jgi:Dolichyl-phosphate-mannose-protein mannosyltransferase
MTTTAVASAPFRSTWQQSPRIAYASLAVVALAKLAIQFAGITRYGFFRDELYYMACGQHLAWGYVDQPPLIAFIAWFARHVFGNSITSIRLLPVLAGAAVVFLTGVLARELSGGRLAQILAATTILLAPAFLAFDSFLSMNAFEPLFWLICALFAVRIVNGASPRLWLAFGAVAGIGLENKHTMAVFGFGIIAGLLLTGNQSILRSKWLWLGGLIALALFLPNLVWEARHGWPQIEVVRNAQEYKNVHIGALRFIAEQTLFLDPLALPIWVAGIVWCFVGEAGKRCRFLGWTYLIVLAIFMVLNGKTYYVAPVYPLLVAAGGVAWEGLTSVAWRRLRLAAIALMVLGGIVTIPFGVPVLPVNVFLNYLRALPVFKVQTERDVTEELPQLYADMFGWQHLTESVSRVYFSLPAKEQPDCAILTGNYGEAGAIDYYGPDLDLPRAISGHNSYFYWGPRNYSGQCVILVGEEAASHKNLFGEATMVATVENPNGVPIEQHVPIYICRKPTAPLAQLWPNFKLII